MNPIDVTVVIPTIPERAVLLARAVDSVARQTRPAAAISIAVDQKGEGGWRTRNRALHAATTEWVAFLDDDDEFLPQHLERCAAWQAETGADLVYPWFTLDHCSDPFDHFGRPWDPEHPVQTTIVTFARRQAVMEVGGFCFEDGDFHDDGGNRAGEDFDMVKRLNKAGYRISHLPERTWVWWHWSDDRGIGNTMGLPERVAARQAGRLS